MIMAPVGSILKVSGNSIAIVAGGPRPGNTPTMVPNKQPRKHMAKFIGVKATEKPCINPFRISIVCAF